MASTDVTRADAPAVAAGVPGLVIRRYAGEADIPELVRVTNAELEADDIPERRNVGEVTAQLRHVSESFDPATDLFVAEIDEKIVGHARVEWVDTTDGLREYRVGGVVDPAWRRRGVGGALHRAVVARAREVAAGHVTDRARWLGMWTSEKSVGAMALAEREDFEVKRWFFEMERPGLDKSLPQLPPMPGGVEIRPLGADQVWKLWLADVEAFQDHWGGFDGSEAAFRRWVERPEWDAALALVAWDGDEIAGGVINTIYAAENAELGVRRGWLDSVFTRRQWRKRGVAKALIARSLHLLARAGMDTAALGVDADNPSGALGLYESFGFAVTERSRAWRKPLQESAP